jgi:hypothetical protein
MKWCGEFRPALSTRMTHQRYQALMKSVSSVMWTGPHGRAWALKQNFFEPQTASNIARR